LGGISKIMEILEDQNLRNYWETELLKNAPRHDIEGAMWTSIGNETMEEYAGLSVLDGAKKDNLSPIQHVMDIMYRTKLNCGFRVVPPASISTWRKVEEDIMNLLQRPDYLVGSDSVISGQMIHPRAYGCFTRILGRLRRRFNIPLELLINRMTKLPAETIGLKGRGEIKEGFYADLVIFNEKEINDLASFEDPEILSTGINQVYVNGSLAFDKDNEIKDLNGYFI
jgi:N-acyl-D-aspartate/D-glutamate deacylase